MLDREGVTKALSELTGTPRLVISLLYGSGLRLLECLKLRIKDVDFGANALIVRRGKGDRDRRTILPNLTAAALKPRLRALRSQHEKDLTRGAGWVTLPDGLARKYPNAGGEWGWQCVFPATRGCSRRRPVQS